jgi:hypothetical protein
MTTTTVDGAPVKVIDTDTHYSEPADLWVSRVPPKYKELVPHQVGSPEKGYAWLVNGDDVLSPRAGAGSVIRKDGTKVTLWDWNIEGGMHVSEVHEASHDPVARVEFMDEVGVWAQIIYPNVAGFEPHAAGLPDLVDRHWDPLWELCSERALPINFHVGASEFGMEAFMKGVWPSLDAERRHVIGCVQIELHNSRIMSNLLISDLFVRFPETKWVSVESGIGWIPYVLERMDYQLRDTTPDGRGFGQPLPSELFRRQMYACFWFEDAGPAKLLEEIGFDNVMFETDFPHPTCLHPSAVEHALKVLEPWGPEVQRKVLQDNAARLYHLPI